MAELAQERMQILLGDYIRSLESFKVGHNIIYDRLFHFRPDAPLLDRYGDANPRNGNTELALPEC